MIESLVAGPLGQQRYGVLVRIVATNTLFIYFPGVLLLVDLVVVKLLLDLQLPLLDLLLPEFLQVLGLDVVLELGLDSHVVLGFLNIGFLDNWDGVEVLGGFESLGGCSLKKCAHTSAGLDCPAILKGGHGHWLASVGICSLDGSRCHLLLRTVLAPHYGVGVGLGIVVLTS